MGETKNWLATRKKRQAFFAKMRRILGGSLIAAVIIGPLVYFSVCAIPTTAPGRPFEGPPLREAPATPEPELEVSKQPIPFPERPERPEIKRGEELSLNIREVKIKQEAPNLTKEIRAIQSDTQEIPDEARERFQRVFAEREAKIKSVRQQVEDDGAELLIMDELSIKTGPAIVTTRQAAETVAINSAQRYLQTIENGEDYSVLPNTQNIDRVRNPEQLVLSQIKTNAGKWYVTFDQYHQAVPVFDGYLKFIFAEDKTLLTLTNNLKSDLPDLTTLRVGRALATENTKAIFEWDDSYDEINFINRGYYNKQPSYKVEAETHNPLGNWEIYINGITGEVEDVVTDIRLQDELPVIDEGATSEPVTQTSSTPEITIEATPDIEAEQPDIEILDILYSRIMGKIYPNTPADEPVIEPMSDQYVYIGQTQHITDEEGYFENPDQQWYSLFLDGPYVTVHDDDATSNAEIKDETPEDPFVWDETKASLAAINAFYHVNKMHNYFEQNQEFLLDKKIPLTVNSHLVDAYLNGCGAWFDNQQKTIEMGRGGTDTCPEELNYALSSDLVYHEYAHFVVEEITHIPNIPGTESAAMGEGIADYFAATINNDSVWGDVVAPNRTRNLDNTLNYQTDMTGQSHHDGQILSGALWDLRQELNPEIVDRLVFNALYQDRLHFETFMYAMIIEDDDNNDFSDGTPHLIAILRAFDNHGIGPGVEGFDGLPITPEEWSKILEEQYPEGTEDPIMRGLSGNCDTTSFSGVLYVPSGGGSCYVSAGSYTYDQIWVYDKLYVGSSTSSTTLTADAGDILVNGGEIGVGTFNANNYVDAVLQTLNSTSNELLVYGGGFVFTRGNTNTGADNYLRIYGKIRIGSSAGSVGRINMVDNSSGTYESRAQNLEVYDEFNIYNGAGVDIAGATYLYESSAVSELTVNSGGVLETNYMYFGDSDGSPAGGELDNDGNINVLYDTYLQASGATASNTDTFRSRFIKMENNTSFTNSGTVTQDWSSYDLHLFDDCTFTNSGILNVYGDLVMDQVSTSAEADRPILDNNSGEVDISNNLNMYNYAEIQNNTAISSPSTQNIDVAGTFTMNNDSKVYNQGRFNATLANINDYAEFRNALNTANNSARGDFYISNDLTLNNQGKLINDKYGTTSNGIVDVIDDITMNSNSRIENYYWIREGYSGTDGSSQPTLTMWNGSDFYNGEDPAGSNPDDTSAFYYNYSSTSGEEGLVRILDSTNVYNPGYFRVRRMRIGEVDPIAYSGGNFYNRSGGRLYVEETSISDHALSMYGGFLNHQSGASTVDVDGITYMLGYHDGSSCTLTPEIENNGSNFNTSSITMDDCTLLDNNATTFTVDGNGSDSSGKMTLSEANTEVYNDGTMDVKGNILMLSSSAFRNGQGSPGTLTVGTSNSLGDLRMRDSSYFQNTSGTITIYDDLIMANETSGATARLDNYGSFNIDGSPDNEAQIYHQTRVNNIGTSAVFDVDYDSTSISDGVVKITDSHSTQPKFYNNGGATLQSHRLELGTDNSYNTTTRLVNSGTDSLVQTSNTGGASIDIYRALLQNTDSATINSAGFIDLSGTSDTNATGKYEHDSTGVSVGKMQVYSYGYAEIKNGEHQCSTCRVMETTTGVNGILYISAGGYLNAGTLEIGTTSNDPGYVSNQDRVYANTMTVYEDSSADSHYEFKNFSGAYLSANTINMGDATHDGGELYNVSGDAVKGGNDGVLASTINMYEDSNIYNGRNRDGILENGNAEINWVTSPTTEKIDIITGGVSFENSGYVGGNAIEVNGSLTYDSSSFNNASDGWVEVNDIAVNSEGIFENLNTYDVPNRPVNVNDIILVTDGGLYSNKGITESTLLRIGETKESISGGQFVNDTNGYLKVTDTGSTAALVYNGGNFDMKNGSETLIPGRLTVGGDDYSATATVYGNAVQPVIGELYVESAGLFEAYDGVQIDIDGGNTGALVLNGSSSNEGLVIVRDTSPGSFIVEGTTTVNAYGHLTNNAYLSAEAEFGFDAYDLVTVNSNGQITSDTDSDFNFQEGLITSGTVEMDDDVLATNNTTSTYAIEVLAGTTTMGLSTNTGGTTSGNIYVSGGTLNSYNDSSITGNVTATGSGAYINFEDSQSPVACDTDIVGDLTATSSSEITINCETTDDAVNVSSASPGGLTTVDNGATLVINTNLETETMVVGDGTNGGTVTHDYVGPSEITLPAIDVFHLTVTDSLDIRTDGELNVNGKSKYQDSAVTNYHGGSHGGRGQTQSTISEMYGQMDAAENEFGNAGICTTSPCTDTTYGYGGGKMSILVGGDGGWGNGTFTHDGTITANGMDYVEGAGAGGSVNIVSYGTMTGSGSIAAMGGNQTGASPYLESAGGGGRVTLQYYDKSGFTGSVLADGGDNVSGTSAGTGTIFYKWYDLWGNETNGVLVIDANNNTVDVDLDGDSDKDDATQTTEDLSIESLQIDRDGEFYWWYAGTGGNYYLDYQQCIEANAGTFYADSNLNIQFNPEHGGVATTKCFYTPDPPNTLYINNSSDTAQSGNPSTKASKAYVQDVTPVASAVHNDAEIDRVPGGDEDTDSAIQYQLQIATTVTLLYTDSPDVCDLDNRTFTTAVTDDNRSEDVDIEYPTCSLSANNDYYWRIRFKDNESGANGWGLWSYTNWFHVDESGTITVSSCNSGANDILLSLDLAAGTPVQFDEDYCTVDVESTTDINITAHKDGLLSRTNPSSTFKDMDINDNYLDGKVDYASGSGEAAFRIDNMGGTSSSLTVLEDLNQADNLEYNDEICPEPFPQSDPCWHTLQTGTAASNNTIFTTSAPVIEEFFDFFFGAAISFPSNDLGVHMAGTYNAIATLTLWSNP